jgi:hypothetical protein
MGPFIKGFSKTAKIKGIKPEHLDQAGLATLAIAPAYHGYKAIKEKNKGEGALAATELGGLGLLSRAVAKSHK